MPENPGISQSQSNRDQNSIPGCTVAPYSIAYAVLALGTRQDPQKHSDGSQLTLTCTSLLTIAHSQCTGAGSGF